MAGLPLLMFIIFPAALALLIRYAAGVGGKNVSFLPLFSSLLPLVSPSLCAMLSTITGCHRLRGM